MNCQIPGWHSNSFIRTISPPDIPAPHPSRKEPFARAYAHSLALKYADQKCGRHGSSAFVLAYIEEIQRLLPSGSDIFRQKFTRDSRKPGRPDASHIGVGEMNDGAEEVAIHNRPYRADEVCHWYYRAMARPSMLRLIGLYSSNPEDPPPVSDGYTEWRR
ncbi:hypothetical protein P154DRAFT_577567 [Amniculicola lignicola CBS 123094]|uniref:Uncharacterized protein n=1 Tax=Amniculicola lignicola CBS 123094 TaxID=1392246 RepID=A0A6A5W9W9_9PLEO|nr:hypothetical protein P154DRAFT_577567 [Amniculicola lignicola CBS 123094]